MLEEFEEIVRKKLGFEIYTYQKSISQEIMKSLDTNKFIVVSMPTGSGKTLIEVFVAHYLLKKGHSVIVLEPTRLLCDQMYHRFWKRIFESESGVEYEGDCKSFEEGKRVIVSTPFTTSKCVGSAEALIVDEVHHAFGDVRYEQTLVDLEPKYLVGFTALLPSYKKYMVDPRLVENLGNPLFLTYDFKALSGIDPTFKLPKAIADIFDADFNSLEDNVYENFFRGKIKGDKNTLKFLEITLYTYGKEAFCESYERLLGKIEETPIIETLCGEKELSHKTRALKDVLTIYKVEDFKPVLIFTSRKSTAYEFEKVVSSFNVKAKVLTGDLSRYERLKIVQDAKKGNVDVIISTLVGEEGIDIPEAKLLIMTDVPQSPLRFYQRLGRLIRGKESNNNDSSALKYLVVTLTPKTPEYDNLDDALRNLYAEGVDVSYIIEKREDKGPVARVVDIVSKAGGKVLVMGIEGKNEDLPDLFSDSPKSHISEYVERAIREGKVIYYYEPTLLGEALSKVFIASYCNVGYGESYIKLCNDSMKSIGRKLLQSKSTLRIDKKSILYNYMKLVLPDELDNIIKELKSEEEEYVKLLEGKDYRINISLNKYKANIKVQISISASIEGVTINPTIHLSYYDIPNTVNEKFIKLNSKVVALYALVKFYRKFSANNC